jgi:RNA polymerase sigma-70 factor (ECF subfamily)
VPEPDVDDAAQRTFIVATQRLTDIKLGNERTFLYGTALRIAGTLRRDRRRRQRIIDPEPVDGISTEPMPDEHLERRQALALLDQVLQHLDDSLREVFVLCEIEELTAPEVAAIIGSAVGTVASRLRRARKKFDVQLKRLQVEPARRR